MLRNALRMMAVATAVCTMLPNPAEAATLNFQFSFVNPSLGGTVEGIIRGLTDNATSAASSVEVVSSTSGFGVGEYVGTPSSNTFTVSSGSITRFDFVSFGGSNTPPAVTSASLWLNSSIYRSFRGGLTSFPDIASVRADSGLVQFTRLPDSVPAPEPNSLLGISALATLGLVAVGKRKLSSQA